MPYRKDDFSSGGYYHVYNRGIASNKIFYRDENYNYFLKLCEKYHSKYQGRMTAYCLMPNHFHLLLQQRGEIPISRFIQVSLNAYVQALNKQMQRKGPLFEGRFRHVLIDKEEYFIYLVRYIHLNPVKACLVDKPEEWPYSDYAEWIRIQSPEGSKPSGGFAKSEYFEWTRSRKKESFVQDYFGGSGEYERFVTEYQDEVLNSNMERYLID